jgi:hypothetical protein
MSAARSSGIAASIVVRFDSATTAHSANEETVRNWLRRSSPSFNRLDPSSRLPGAHRLGRGDAVVSPAGQAVEAPTARGEDREHDVVAPADPVRSRSDRLDHPGGLVPEHGRVRDEPALAVDRAQITRAQARAAHPDQDLTGFGLGEVHVAHLDRVGRR